MISPTNIEKLKNFALQLTEKSGTVLEKYWGKLTNIQEKEHPGDLVTNADKESEKVILDDIKKSYPTHSILAEESGLSESKHAEFQWIIDPIDGTTNYAHQYPFVAISIALLYQGEPIVAVISNPILNEVFFAAKNHHSTLNNKKIYVSNAKKLKDCLLATGFPYDRTENPDTNYKEFCHLTQITQGVRRAGSAALDLAYVAAGRLDGFWERGLKPWDIAAGSLIVEQAGGKVSNYEGKKLDLFQDRILATNGIIHLNLSKELIKMRSKN